MNGSWKTLRFCFETQRKVSGDWIDKIKISEFFPSTGMLILSSVPSSRR